MFQFRKDLSNMKVRFSFQWLFWSYIMYVKVWHITGVKQYVLIVNLACLFYSIFTLESIKNTFYLILKHLCLFY